MKKVPYFKNAKGKNVREHKTVKGPRILAHRRQTEGLIINGKLVQVFPNSQGNLP